MASEGSDTDMSSSSSANSESSDSARSWGDDSSEGSGSAQPPAAAAAARRVPPLALGGNLAALSSAVAPHGEEDNRGPGTARQAGPRLVPRLSLPSAAAAAAVSAAAPAPASARRLPSPPRRPAAAAMQHRQEHQQVSAPQRQQEQEQEQQTRAASQAALVSLDILSPAFSVEQGEQAGSSINGRQQLAQRCASKLGVPADRLRYYALVEVSGPQDLPPDCARAAVEVVGSSEFQWTGAGCRWWLSFKMVLVAVVWNGWQATSLLLLKEQLDGAALFWAGCATGCLLNWVRIRDLPGGGAAAHRHSAGPWGPFSTLLLMQLVLLVCNHATPVIGAPSPCPCRFLPVCYGGASGREQAAEDSNGRGAGAGTRTATWGLAAEWQRRGGQCCRGARAAGTPA